MQILSADFVFPVSGPPIRDGAIVIDGDRIVDVGGKHAILQKYTESLNEDFGRAAILPGLVNCHAHLELTALRGALCDSEGDFGNWLLRVNQLRGEAGEENLRHWARIGAMEAAAAGITTIGDVGRFAEIGFFALKETGLRGIAFQETEFSPDNRTAETDFRLLAERVEKLCGQANHLVKLGISPHSPYTVSSRLFELTAEFSILNRLPMAIHTAESAAEDALMRGGNGFFADIYAKFGFEWTPPLMGSVEYLERLGVLAARPLLIHCVNVTSVEIEKICDYGATIAHCPKSNAKLGHGIAPLADFLNSGVSVGLGSDSVASNNICDLFEEARFSVLAARTRKNATDFITPQTALEMATIGGAKALGLEREIGTLDPGKQADICIVSLAALATQPVNDPISAVIYTVSGRDVIRTYVAGKCVFDRAATGNATN